MHKKNYNAELKHVYFLKNISHFRKMKKIILSNGSSHKKDKTKRNEYMCLEYYLIDVIIETKNYKRNYSSIKILNLSGR